MDLIINWLATTPSLAEPYVLAALGLMISERAGVLSLGAEGFMLVGALAGVGTGLSLGCGAPLALLVAMAVTALASVIFAVFTTLLRVNQVIVGLTTVFFFQGLTDLIGTLAEWNNRTVPGLDRWPIEPLSRIPALGPILFNQDVVIYLTIPAVAAIQFILWRTLTGLRLRAVGDSPETADAVGVSVSLYRFGAVIIGSAIVGLAGAYLALVDIKVWAPGETHGRGWIAVALVIFSRWRPWRALFGALLFGGIEALIPQIGAAGFHVPQYFMLMTPYIVTIAVMIRAGAGKSVDFGAPMALGRPFVREERR
jgi:general nucleoside transport system permease protein